MDKLDERIVMRVAALLIKQATTVKQRRKARTRRCMMPRSVTSLLDFCFTHDLALLMLHRDV